MDEALNAPTRTSAPSGVHATPAPGRFLPGAVLADRYRIHGLLGAGGMGEVYRADDLKLGQVVALKFLPEGVERDPGRLARFLQEVKIARQVSHPNVCRVYDVLEVHGHHVLSMEYVDGEDLASLLRRIGRLPSDKALQIARQLCAGLAAAHELGVLHRDLKPANVMIDGRGRARITDFGLAVIGEQAAGSAEIAGTPAYMAPEQLAGKPLTLRSDLYALGLVLYEIFTGRRPFKEGASRDAAPTHPSHHVERMDPAVERVILRCLESDPKNRPASAQMIAAAFPGGDPLAAAVAAGETPSPELVAEAGAVGGLRPRVAVACVLGAIFGTALVIAFSSQVQISRVAPLPKAPAVLVERAKEILTELGAPAGATDSAFGFAFVKDYGDYLREHLSAAEFWRKVGDSPPSLVDFWYRQSPRGLVPLEPEDLDYGDPPVLVPGMAGVRLDSDGRLKRLDVVPIDRDDAKGPWPAPHWEALLRAAGLDPAQLTPVDPVWVPRVFADARAAWQPAAGGATDAAIRVEAAAYHGTPVYFRTIGPWTQPFGSAGPPASLARRIVASVPTIMVFVVLIGGSFLARRNLRLGRCDRRGAARVGIFVLIAGLADWALNTHHVASSAEVGLFLTSLALRVLVASTSWVFYLAIEPFVRRLWPQVLVSWVRVLEGRFSDPLVGRDVLFGILAGAGLQLLNQAWPLASRWWGTAPPALDELGPTALELAKLGGLRFAFANLPGIPVASFLFNSAYVLSLLLLRAVLKKDWLAGIAFVVVWTYLPATGSPFAALLFSTAYSLATLLIFFRIGFLAVYVAYAVQGVLMLYPMTFDLSRWYAGNTIVAVIVLTSLIVYGFRVALGGRPLWSDDRLEG